MNEVLNNPIRVPLKISEGANAKPVPLLLAVKVTGGKLVPLEAVENGTYSAPTGVGYTPVTVAVPVPEDYTGSYEVESILANDQILSTSGKRMTDDMTVRKITVEEVINQSGGYTVVIGS